MSMTFNMVGGGGGIPGNRAVLVARIPSGSTVTATKGGVTLTPMMWVSETYPDQDIALFVFTPAQFDATNPWTITATDGTDTASDTVLITANKEYEVTLEYGLVLFNYGATDYAFSASRSASSYGSGGYEFVDDYLSVYAQWAQTAGSTYTDFHCTTAVDASKYSTLEVEYKSNYSSTISIRSSPNGSDLKYVTADVNTGTTPVKAVLDISDIVSQVYFAVRISAGGATKNSINMYKITFKP